MILNLLKRAWPVLRLFGRAPVSRATYVLTETGLPLTTETGEVITIE